MGNNEAATEPMLRAAPNVKTALTSLIENIYDLSAAMMFHSHWLAAVPPTSDIMLFQHLEKEAGMLHSTMYDNRIEREVEMKMPGISTRRAIKATIACGLASAVLGCTVIGPESIRTGRLAYNEAITETNNQQMLMVLVHNRYDEPNALLAVSSVTANVKMSSQAGVQAGFGNSATYDGNLVPFSGGFVYEENPTISYTPVTGEAYLSQLMSPVPVSLFAQVTHTIPYPEYAYDMLLSSVNGIRSPAFLFGSQQDDPRFDRFVAIMTELTHQHALYWSGDPGNLENASLIIEPSTVETEELATQLLELLGIPQARPQDGQHVIPVSLALRGADTGRIGIITRTIHELVEILSAAVEVPARDEDSGIAAEVPRPGRAGRELKIHFADERPEEAYVALEYRDGWFYIDSRDQATKRYFKLLGSLWSSAMAQSLDSRSSTPILTVPVSR